MTNLVPRHTAQLLIEDFGDGILVFDSNTQKAVNLEGTQAEIFRLCDGTRSVGEITAAIPAEAQPHIEGLLVQLNQEGLLEGLNVSTIGRRSILKAAAALPALAIVMAPDPLAAASNCVNESSCNTQVSAATIQAGMGICRQCDPTNTGNCENAFNGGGTMSFYCQIIFNVVGGAGGMCSTDTLSGGPICAGAGDGLSCNAARAFAVTNGDTMYSCCDDCT
jgi:hypothetical protein